MGLIRLGPQTVGSLIGYHFVPCVFCGMFYLSEGWILGSDTQIVFIDTVLSSVLHATGRSTKAAPVIMPLCWPTLMC